MLNPYEVMYDARMTVQRWREAEKGGYIRNELFTVGENILCRYSSSGQAAVGTPNPSIQNSHTLFCDLEADVQEGDRITVTMRTGKTVDLTLGECHPYTYQWQCEVKRKDNA